MQTHKVTIQFRAVEDGGRLMGGIPANPEALLAWSEAQGVPQEAVEAAQLSAEEMVQAQDAKVLKLTTTFYKDGDKGYYIAGHQINGLLKETAWLLGYTRSKAAGGLSGFSRVLTQGVIVHPSRIYLGKQEADGTETFGAQVQTPMGRRSIVRIKEWVDMSAMPLSFEVRVLDPTIIKEKHIRAMFEAGQEIGLGSGRRIGEGKYTLLSIS